MSRSNSSYYDDPTWIARRARLRRNQQGEAFGRELLDGLVYNTSREVEPLDEEADDWLAEHEVEPLDEEADDWEHEVEPLDEEADDWLAEHGE